MLYEGNGYLIPVGMVAGDSNSFTEYANLALDMLCDDCIEIGENTPLEYVPIADLVSATLDGEDFSDAYGVFIAFSDGADDSSATVNAIMTECGVENTNGYFGHIRVESID